MKTRIYARIAARFLLALLSLASFYPGLTHAQTFDLTAARVSLTQVDSAWRFHLGDDPNWAQSGFDDTSWPVLHPEDGWTAQGYPAKTELAWFRFRLRAPAHTQTLALDLPGIEKSFQLFCDGQLIGQVGALPPGPAHNVIGGPRIFTLPVNSGAGPKDVTVALRLWQDPATAGSQGSVLEGAAYAGAPEAIQNHFDADRAEEYLAIGEGYTEDIVILIVGAAVALLFWLTRERFYLWFACNLILQASFLFMNIASELQAWSLYFTTDIRILTDLLVLVTYIFFLISAIYPDRWKISILPIALALLAELSIILVLKHMITLKWGDIGYCLSVMALYLVLTVYLLRGWRAGIFYANLLFFPFGITALFNILLNLGNVLRDTGFPLGTKIQPNRILLLHSPFQVSLFDLGQLISLLGFLAVLVYRFARTSREQQRLASALQAAHDIQNRLVPVNIPVLGGLRAEIAYRAAEEVGGDFCQILPRPDGSILVVIGDVSGKGLQAAMLGAVAVGALRSLADEEISPAAVLERLNHVLLRTENSGFVTCLCLVLTPEGEVLVANAGHLAPYLDGAEIPVEPGLPLGIVAGVRYSEDTFMLPGNARLTLLSDGVVEARSGSGELFGFERTCEVSRLAASEIADRAHQFGQEDDITVITLDWRASILAAA